MATCDPDGKVAQMVADMHACLAMSLHEGLRDAVDEFAAVLDEIHATGDVPPGETAP